LLLPNPRPLLELLESLEPEPLGKAVPLEVSTRPLGSVGIGLEEIMMVNANVGGIGYPVKEKRPHTHSAFRYVLDYLKND
jgi:hypothetical protein